MNIQNLLKLIFGVVLIILLPPTVSCYAANPSALVGHWLHESGDKGEKPEDIELFKDGTGVCDGKTISWKVENKRFIIQSASFGLASDYEVSGSRLTFTNNAGKSTYVNVNSKNYQQKGIFTDTRDGKKYGTVKIGNQIWFAENLNYEMNGYCYEKDPANCKKYGRLYNWFGAKEVCPVGWHLPRKEEWETLVNFIGGNNVAGKKLKAKSGWNYGNGTDIFGFMALPGGKMSHPSRGYFYDAGGSGSWWSASEVNNMKAYYLDMHHSEYVTWEISGNLDLYTSVRCVQLTAEAKQALKEETARKELAAKQSLSNMTDTRDNTTYKTVKIGEQVWMAENLNYNAESSKCYNDDPANCAKYGRLYNWETAMALPLYCGMNKKCVSQISAKHRGICPSGWHLPSNREWGILYHYVDGTSGTESPYRSETAGKYLKATSGWNNLDGSSGNGEDKYGFAALPGGSGNDFEGIGTYGSWLTSQVEDRGFPYHQDIYSNSERAFGRTDGGYNSLYSVRCIKD